MEKRHRRKEDHKRLEMAEKIYSQVNDEVQNEFENQRKAIVRPTRKLKDIDNGEDLWKLFETSHDAETFEVFFFCIFTIHSNVFIRKFSFSAGFDCYSKASL